MKLLVAVPAMLVAVIEAYLLATASLGAHPFWHPVRVSSLPEAVALRDGPEIVRRLDGGEDPNARGHVRAGWLDSEPHDATPLEAAAFNRRPELVALLLANGATLDAASWTRLYCASANRGSGDIAGLLETVRPAGATTGCTGSETFW